MGEMASLWGYAEDMEQLGQKLLYTTLELEKLKAEANEEMQKNKEYIKQLIHLLKFAIQERDEARNQLNKLLNKQYFPAIPQFQSDTNFLKPGKANSSITESNSLSETHNYGQSHNSSPVESLFDAVSSPEFSNINFVINQQQPLIDQESLIIDNLVRGRVLPQKGKFLQAVLETGPLLQTLLVAGPLPRWRNPPQMQPFQIPPVSIKGCDAVNVGQLDYSRSMNSQCYNAQISNFSNLASGTCVSNAVPISSAVFGNDGFVRFGKRQRFC